MTSLIVTRGFGNGTLTGSVAKIVTAGYNIAEDLTWTIQNPVTTTWTEQAKVVTSWTDKTNATTTWTKRTPL